MMLTKAEWFSFLFIATFKLTATAFHRQQLITPCEFYWVIIGNYNKGTTTQKMWQQEEHVAVWIRAVYHPRHSRWGNLRGEPWERVSTHFLPTPLGQSWQGEDRTAVSVSTSTGSLAVHGVLETTLGGSDPSSPGYLLKPLQMSSAWWREWAKA